MELDYIKKGICPFCKQKIYISEFRKKIEEEGVDSLNFIKHRRIRHFRENKNCVFARKN